MGTGMGWTRNIAGGLALASIAVPALAAKPPPDRRNFVSCPVVRDTKTVPCWLAEYKGETYFLGVQVDFGAEFWPPYLGHQVLVEGVATDAPRICGGIVLKPVKVSSLPEPDKNCNTMLPAEDRYTIPFETRGPGPNGRPSINRPPPPPRPAAPAPQKPYAVREFTILNDFNNRIWNVRATPPMQQARDYAIAIGATEVEIVAYRGASLLSDGVRLVEDEGVAEMRAKQVGEILQGVGVPAASLKVRWKTAPEPADGVNDGLKRRTVITVRP